MAPAEEDDLNAFFDDVSQAEAQAVQEKPEHNAKPQEHGSPQQESSAAVGTTNEEEEPPKKKQKTTDAPPPVVRPRGVVVAAAASSLKAHPPSSDNDDEEEDGTLSPFIPQTARERPTTAATTATTTSTNNKQKQKGGGHLRLFVGNLGNEVNEAELHEHFAANKKYNIVQVSIVRDGRTQSSKGYGFVDFDDALECARAKREMDQTWLSSRPIRIKKYTQQQNNKQQSKKGKRRGER